MKNRGWGLACSFALSLQVASLEVQAQSTSDLGARRQLIESARQAETDGDYARALDLGLRANQIMPSASLHYFLSEQQRRLGRFGDALGNAERCAAMARDTNQSVPDRALITRTCTRMIDEIRPLIARVVVRLPDPVPPGVQVSVAGQPMNPAFYGVEYAVNPGDVEVVITVQGAETLRRTVNIAGGRAETLDINASDLEPSAASHTDATTAISDTTTTTRTEQSQTDTSASSSQSSSGPGAGPIVLIGLGGVSVITSVVLFVLTAQGVADFQNTHCNPENPSSCRPGAESTGELERLNAMDAASWVTAGVGAAALLGGVVWMVAGSSSSNSSERASRRWAPMARWSGQQVIVGVGGVW